LFFLIELQLIILEEDIVSPNTSDYDSKLS